MCFHERLVAIMNARGLKQVDICELTGLSSAQANHLVNGRTKDPKLSTAIKVADALGVSLDYLAGRSSPPPPPNYADKRQRKLNADFEELSDVGRESAVSTVAALLGVERARGSEKVPGDVSEAV